MGASPQESPGFHPSDDPSPPLHCPEDVDWIFDVDTLRNGGAQGLVQRFNLQEASLDNPHHPFLLSESSVSNWDQAVRRLSMAAGESHLVIAAHGQAGIGETVFYTRVAGYREDGLPRIVANFRKLDQTSYQSVTDTVRNNWLYLLHEIKTPLSLLRATANDPGEANAEIGHARRYAINALENHLRNGVFLATEDTRQIPVHPEPVDLKFFFEDLCVVHRPLLNMHENTLRLQLDIDAVRSARLDPVLLGQILNNLLVNKVNLLHGQEVLLTVSHGSVRKDGTGSLLHVTIEDEGPPFPDFVLNASESTPDLEGLMQVTKNSGLGLSICRRIISVLNGELHFFNDPPKTRIRLHLPLG
jgi:signal transduction histidine kinase